MSSEAIVCKPLSNFFSLNLKYSYYRSSIYQSYSPIKGESDLAMLLKEFDNSVLSKFFSISVENNFLNLRLKLDEALNLRGFFVENRKKILEGRKVLIDTFGVNFGKAVHFGHIRCGIIGSVVARLYKRFGASVHVDTHFGDYGKNLAIYINYFKDREEELVDLTIDRLSEIYRKCSEEETCCYKPLIDFEKGDKLALKIYEKLKEITMKYVDEIAEMFGFPLDFYYGESRYISLCRYIELAYKNHICLDGENRKVVKETNLVLTRSDNTVLYSFTDLATLFERLVFNKYDNVYYVVDCRQSYHFEQLFKSFSLITGISTSGCKNVGYGVVKANKNEIFKSRVGDKTFNIVDFVSKLSSEISVSREIVSNALILFELKHKASSDYIFDVIAIKSLIISYLNFNKKVSDYIRKGFDEVFPSEGEEELVNRLIQVEEVFINCLNTLETNVLYTHFDYIVKEVSKLKIDKLSEQTLVLLQEVVYELNIVLFGKERVIFE